MLANSGNKIKKAIGAKLKESIPNQRVYGESSGGIVLSGKNCNPLIITASTKAKKNQRFSRRDHKNFIVSPYSKSNEYFTKWFFTGTKKLKRSFCSRNS